MDFRKSISEHQVILLAVFLTMAAFLLMLGKAPLYLEEPRRAIIAMEMVFFKNYWAPTLLGDWYYNKPPLFTWVLLAFVWIGKQMGAGPFEEFWLRLPSVLSAGAIAGILYQVGRKEVNVLFGARAGLFFLSFGSIALFFSLLAEIDLFYTLIVFGSFLLIWYFGEREAYLLLFLSTYLLCAIGVLTKGLPSLAFTAISLLVYFADKRRMGVLFSFSHAMGILLLSGILGGYLWKYGQYHAIENLLYAVFEESGRRTAAAMPLVALPGHLALFPLNVLMDMLPGSLMVFLLLRRDVRNLLLQRHPFIRFCTLMLLANLLLYWFSPGARVRYVYPLFPFAALLFAWAYELKAEAPVWASVWVERVIKAMGVAAASGFVILIFFPDIRSLPFFLPVAFTGFLGFIGIWRLSCIKSSLTLPLLFVGSALFRLLFDFTVLPHRALYSGARQDKDLAAAIHRATDGRPLYLYGEEKVVSYTTCFYLNRFRKQPLVLQDQLQKDQFYLLPLKFVGPKDSILLRTSYEGVDKALIMKRY